MIQPLFSLGTGVMSAFWIFNGAFFAASRLAKGFLKNESTLLDGRQLSRVISTFAVRSSERTTPLAAT